MTAFNLPCGARTRNVSTRRAVQKVSRVRVIMVGRDTFSLAAASSTPVTKWNICVWEKGRMMCVRMMRLEEKRRVGMGDVDVLCGRDGKQIGWVGRP